MDSVNFPLKISSNYEEFYAKKPKSNHKLEMFNHSQDNNVENYSKEISSCNMTRVFLKLILLNYDGHWCEFYHMQWKMLCFLF